MRETGWVATKLIILEEVSDAYDGQKNNKKMINMNEWTK